MTAPWVPRYSLKFPRACPYTSFVKFASVKSLVPYLEYLCPSGDTWQCLEIFLAVIAGVGVLLFLPLVGGGGPGMLLFILECTGQPPTTENWPQILMLLS